MLWQLIQEAFEVDGRITQSLYLLFLKPGALSTAFSNNQRASFISPIRLYLFTSILFFFVAALEAPDIRNSDFTIDPPEEVTEIDSVSVTKFKETLDPKFHEHVDRIMAGEGFSRDTLTNYINEYVTPRTAAPSSFEAFFDERVVSTLDDPFGFAEDFVEQLPVALFFLVPAYALLLKLLYVRQKKYYVEHFVFALHLHSFAFILFTTMLLIPDTEAQPWAGIETAVQLGFFVYYFVALKRYYNQGALKTTFKYIFLLNAYSVLIIPAVIFVMLTTFALA